MLKTILSLLCLSVILMSCCDCDCPDEPVAVVTETAAVTEEEVEPAPSDSAIAEAPVPETTALVDPVTETATQKNVSDVKPTPDNNNTKPKPVNMDELFGNGGSTGNDGNSGSGDSFGSGTGGSGVGDPGDMEDSPIRRQISSVNLSMIQTASDETIMLQIAIDGGGNVTKASVIKSKTTTTDQALIDQVIKEVKRQLKYSPNTGAALKYDVFTVKLRAN